jgi:hypothetical protein
MRILGKTRSHSLSRVCKHFSRSDAMDCCKASMASGRVGTLAGLGLAAIRTGRAGDTLVRTLPTGV